MNLNENTTKTGHFIAIVDRQNAQTTATNLVDFWISIFRTVVLPSGLGWLPGGQQSRLNFHSFSFNTSFSEIFNLCSA